MSAGAGLNFLDYIVVVAYLTAFVAFGAWFGRFQRTTRDYRQHGVSSTRGGVWHRGASS